MTVPHDASLKSAGSVGRRPGKRPRAAAALCLCMVFTSCHYRPPSTEQSPFAIQSMADSIPPEWRDEPVIVLSDSIEVDFIASKGGNSVRREERTWYYINKRNPEALSNLWIYDFETIETVPEITITILYPDGRKSFFTSSDIKRFRGAGQNEFTTNRMVNWFSVPNYQAGMFIRIGVSRNYARPSFISSEYLRDEYPCLEKRISLSWPAECRIHHALHNTENLALDTIPARDGSVASFTVTGKNLKKMQIEHPLRFPEQWYAGLHFSLPPDSGRSLSWKELGDHYLELLAPSLTSSAEIKKMAGTIADTDERIIIEKAFQLIQHNVRYHAREEKIYAIIPRPASEILAAGYGDCKEMSTLLKMILAEKGITSHLALVSYPGIFQAVDSVPSLDGFNHLILYLPRFGREAAFLDPTVQFGHCGNSYYHLINQKAYIVEKGNSRLTGIEPRPGEGITRVFTSSRIKRSPNGDSWEMTGEIRLSDNAAYLFYPFLRELKGEENNPGLAALLKSSFNLEAHSVKLAGCSPDSIVVRYTANVTKNYVDIDKGGFVIETPSLFGGPTRFTTIKQEGPRIFEEILQRDEWIVPAEFGELQSSDLSHTIASGGWSKRGTAVSRSFSLVRIVLPESRESEVASFFCSKSKFLKATVWRK